VRRNEAGRHKSDSQAGVSYRTSYRKVVTDGMIPGVTDAGASKYIAAQSHGAAPCEIPGVRTQRGDNRCIPDRTEKRRYRSGLRHIPAITGGNTNGFICQWRNQIRNPVFRVSGIGIAEHKDFRISRGVLDRVDEVVNFLAASCRDPGNQHRRA